MLNKRVLILRHFTPSVKIDYTISSRNYDMGIPNGAAIPETLKNRVYFVPGLHLSEIGFGFDE
jgi:hypothetical protein